MAASEIALSGPVLGVVLAGGRSRRMGGRDKAFLRLGDRTLIARALERLRPQVDARAISANGEACRFAACGVPVIADTVFAPEGGAAGPLAGVLAALDWAVVTDTPPAWLATVPVDTPFFPGDLVARLVAAATAGDRLVAIACSGGRRHPVCAVWSRDCRDRLRHALVAEGRRALHQITRDFGGVVVEWPSGPPDPFLNVNTPQDLARAHRRV